MRTTDNNLGGFKVENENDHQNLTQIANESLETLVKKSPNLLVFPQKLGEHKDKIQEKPLFHLVDNQLTTHNFMGFVGYNDSTLTICSRFYPENDDFFLHYLLQKVFRLNILNLPVPTNDNDIWDIFLLYLFPYHLQKAINQGIYKEYQQKYYNDSQVKGKIDVARHLRQNLLFNGNVAYNTREHSHDNRLTQLIRHTIEYIQMQILGRSILYENHETQSNVRQIQQATPSYLLQNRREIIRQNQKIVSHPYFTEYENVRKICLQVLRKEGLSYEKEKDKTFGLVFDGAWLWEEYLNTILKELGFTHTENNTGKHPTHLFEKSKGVIYPDFYILSEIVLDAKYKRLKDNKINRNDMYQIISYLHVLKAKKGGLIFPSESKIDANLIGNLNGFGGEIWKYPFFIPQKAPNWVEFRQKMKEQEKDFSEEVKSKQ